MRVLLTSAICSLLLLLAGCASGTEGPSGPGRSASERMPSWISLERTPSGSGEATSPVYVVTLFEDGRVLFEGHRLVKSKGTFTRTIPREEAERVFRRMHTIRLWDRQPRYDEERAMQGGDEVIVRTASTETSWDILRASDRGRTVRIDGLFFAPRELIDFKEMVEKVVGLAAWVGEPSEWQR